MVPDPKEARLTLPGLALAYADQLGNGGDRDGRVHLQDEGRTVNPGDHRDVANKIESDLGVERRIDGVARDGGQKGIPVGRRAHDRLRRDIRSSTRPVLDDEWLTEPVRQPFSNQASGNVGRPAGGKPDQDIDWACRIGLRLRDARHGQQGNSARYQVQNRVYREASLRSPMKSDLRSRGEFSARRGVGQLGSKAILFALCAGEADSNLFVAAPMR